MNPYYENGGITIIHGDAHEVLPALADKEFDLSIWDPPHNCGIRYDAWNDNFPQSEYQEAMWKITVGCRRVSRNQVCLAPRDHLPFFFSILPGSHMVVIRRQNGSLKAGWFDSYGVALALGLPAVPADDLWYDLNEEKYDYDHPGISPRPIIHRFAQLFAPTSLIDPCCGSGTSLVVAKELGLTAVGIEISEKYCEIAAKRLCEQGVAA